MLLGVFQVKKMVHAGQEVIVISGSHALHDHEKLAVAVSKAMRSHSLHETKSDGRFHVRTKTYLDGAILKEVCWSWILALLKCSLLYRKGIIFTMVAS
jgi:hypothetical protein